MKIIFEEVCFPYVCLSFGHMRESSIFMSDLKYDRYVLRVYNRAHDTEEVV